MGAKKKRKPPTSNMFKTLLFLAFVAFCAADIWSNCGSGSDHIKIDKVVIKPDPPVRGKNFTITASGVLDEKVTGGSVTADINYGVVPVLKKTEDLCDVLKKAHQLDPSVQECPVPSQTQTLASPPILIPSDAPAGHYHGKVSAVDQNKQEIICIALDLQLK